jgi:hypothetical protein
MTHDDPHASEPTPADSVDDLLDQWWLELSTALGLAAVPIERSTLLALAGDAAHGVVRPAAPLTTFLAGYAAGLAGGDEDALARAVATATEAIRLRADTA